jgi:hypothetical protein
MKVSRERNRFGGEVIRSLIQVFVRRGHPRGGAVQEGAGCV